MVLLTEEKDWSEMLQYKAIAQKMCCRCSKRYSIPFLSQRVQKADEGAVSCLSKGGFDLKCYYNKLSRIISQNLIRRSCFLFHLFIRLILFSLFFCCFSLLCLPPLWNLSQFWWLLLLLHETRFRHKGIYLRLYVLDFVWIHDHIWLVELVEEI